MLPLISGWEREKVHPCSAAPGFGAIGARLESPAWPPGQTCGEEGERHFDKAKSANSPLPGPPRPAGKSDKHPALNRLSVGAVLHCLYLWQVGTGGGTALPHEGHGFVAEQRDVGAQHLSLNCYVLPSPQ